MASLAAVVLVAPGCGGEERDSAGLAFTRYQTAEKSSVWVADADGSHERKLADDAYGATISPDGRRVAYLISNKDPDAFPPILALRDVSGGNARRVGPALVYAWSPDGKRLAVSDRTILFVLDVGSGQRRVVARGAVFDFSFAPDGRALAYAGWNDRVGRDHRSDIFVVRLADGRTKRLTDDGHSDEPVWGRGWIVYRRFHLDGWPIGRLWLMRPDGSGRRFLAQGDERVGQAKMGLRPLELSADGKRLLACAAAEFYCAPAAIAVPSGRRYRLGIEGNRVLVQQGELPQAGDLSSDGRELLFEVSPFDSSAFGRVYAIPFVGGRARLILRDAVGASWAD